MAAEITCAAKEGGEGFFYSQSTHVRVHTHTHTELIATQLALI